MKKIILGILTILSINTAWASEADPLSQVKSLIETTSNKVISLTQEAQAYVDQEPERYYQQIANELTPVFDFDYFSRAVMGHTASNRYLQTLSPDEQNKARQQIANFTTALTTTLRNSYGKTFLKFADSKLEIDSAELQGNTQASVVQKITDPKGTVYTIQYSMRLIKGQWKIQNFIVEGINMGQSYRAQFQTALDTYQGDIDQVISHWPEIMNENEK